jgi:undecaprenyl-diphosphatase
MTIIQSIILGIVQGITEFVPVSSSGHLVLTPYIFGWDIPEQDAFVFNVLVQVGTIVAVILYFWKDLAEIITGFVQGLVKRDPFGTLSSRLGWYIILATIPASIAGLLLRSSIESAFNSPVATAIFLLLTALLLLLAERAGSRRRTLQDLTWRDALLIGIFQILALFPGVSRSGATITGGMMSSLDRPTAARFSFLMSIPIMLAAGGLAFLDLLQIPDYARLLPPFIAGFITSTIAGMLAIHWLLRYLARRPLYIFAVYCVFVSIGILVMANYSG